VSDFAALNTALSGLLAHRKASEVTGQNIANVNTPGYSRQRIDLTASASGTVPAVWARSTTVGNGVDVVGQTRIRDEFLERRFLAEQATSSSLTRQAQTLSRVEAVFAEPSDTALAAQLADYWAAWDDVANQPSSEGARSSLLERGTTVVEAFNRAATELGQLRDAAAQQVTTTIEQVNALAARIADLNGSIRNATAAGLSPNELSDQRDLLVNELSTLVGVTTRAGEHGTVEVAIGGTSLVTGNRAERLQVADLPAAPPNAADPTSLVGWGQVQVQWARDGYPVTLTGGEVHGLVQAVNDVLPRHLDQLNTLSVTLRNDVNGLHATGYGSDGGTGRDFFSATPAGPPYIGAAAGLALSSGPDGVAGHPEWIAASGVATPVGNQDVSVAQQLAALHDSPSGVDAAYRAFIGRLGVEAQSVSRRSIIQDAVTHQVDTQRLAVSGVNIDEEMVNLTLSQHAYNAAARVLTTIDSMIDTLVNRTGLVGR